MVDVPQSSQSDPVGPTSLLHKLTELLNCRICLQVSLIVCFSILLVEAAILVPSSLRLENSLYDRLDAEALRIVQAVFRDHEHQSLDDMLDGGMSQFASAHVAGVLIHSNSGSVLAAAGEVPATDSATATDRKDVVLTARDTGLPFQVVARMDTRHIGEELQAYILRVGGLVLIIAVFVSAVTIATIRLLVLEPLLRIRRNLFGAQNDPANPDHYRIETTRDDEIGDTIRTLNTLLERLSTNRRSELLEREQRTKDYADASSDWFWEMDENLRFSHFSGRFTEVSGVDEEALLGKTRQETGIPSVDREAWEEHLDNLENRRAFRNFVHPRTKADGTVVWLSINGKPIFDDQGVFRGYRGAGSDITRLKLVEEQLAKKTAKIESQAEKLQDALKTQIEYNNLQRDFVSMASHEFRTPLTIIDIAAQRLIRKSKQLSPDDLSERVGVIRDAVKRLVRLIESTLDAAKAEAGTIEFDPRPVDVKDLIAGVRDRMQEIAPTHPITLDLHDAAKEICGDPGLLDQILTNLLSNAIKYSPDGSAVELTGGGDDETLIVRIRDRGIGIPQNEIPKLFQKYFRASTATGIAGTGLGLHLIRKLTAMHGGSIEVDSVEGEGSTFTLRLPVKGVPQTQAEGTGPDAGALDSGPMSSPRKRTAR